MHWPVATVRPSSDCVTVNSGLSESEMCYLPRMTILSQRFLSTLTTGIRGNVFEEKSVSVLQTLSMSLSKVAGEPDGGVGRQGCWFVPMSSNRLSEKKKTTREGSKTWIAPDGTIRRRLRIFAQFKAEQEEIGPQNIREFKGVLGRHEISKDPLIGLLVSESPFSLSALLTAYSSSLPLFLLQLPFEPEAFDGESIEPETIGSAVWNRVLSDLFRGDLEARWERSIHCPGGRPTLWQKCDNSYTGVAEWIPPEMKDERQGKKKKFTVSSADNTPP